MTQPGFFIRRANINDMEQLAELCSETFIDTYSGENKKSDIQHYIENNFSAENITRELLGNQNVFFVSEKNGRFSGYVKLTRKKSKTEIARIYVRKEYFGTGLARQLVEKSKEYSSAEGIRTLYLAVWQNNHRAIAFYKKCGFLITGNTTFDWGTGKIDKDLEMELTF
ncbi:MAG: GNAT family N-acetyltransferase [Bacteroidota bacterium]